MAGWRRKANGDTRILAAMAEDRRKSGGRKRKRATKSPATPRKATESAEPAAEAVLGTSEPVPQRQQETQAVPEPQGNLPSQEGSSTGPQNVPGSREPQRPESAPKPKTEQPVTEKPVPEKPPAQKPLSEKPVTEKPATDRPTEKPVPTKKKVSRYTVYVDDATGLVEKIEKMDEKTGQGKELSQQEYASVYAFSSTGSPLYGAYGAYGAPHQDPLSSPAIQAYFKGISDYVKALTESG
jgi:hypothetical protein